MELRSVIKKIMESEDLKSKLKSLGSFDEVYEFFVANGYEGDAEELKEKLLGKSAKFSAVTDDDLSKVAGGVLGRQVLSACTGFMMLMGLPPFMNFQGHAITTPLHVAVKEGNLDDIKGFFEKNHDAINEEDENGLTPLHHAVINKDLDKVKYLVENGADVNAPCLRDWYNALTNHNEEEGDRLRHENPNWNYEECGVTPLIRAADNDDLETVKYLIEHGANVKAQTLYQYTALHSALSRENFNMDLVKYLVEHGADVNAKSLYGKTALNFALVRGFYGVKDKIDINLVKYLVENGADLNTANAAYGVLHNVVDKEVLDYLLQRGADPNTGVATALAEQNMELLKYFVDHGADVNNTRWPLGEPLLYYVNNPEWIDYLVKNGADINVKDSHGMTLLSSRVNIESIECLVKHGAKIGDGVVERVVEYGYLDIVKYLVEHGAKIGDYAVERAARSGRFDIVKYLVEHGADVNAKVEEDGSTQLHWVGDMELVKYLVEHGANVNAKDKQGKTPLDRALAGDMVDKARYLVNHGAHCSDSGWDFVVAVWLGNAEVVDSTIENGEDVNDRIIGAALFGREDLIDHLLEKGAGVEYGLFGAGIALNMNMVDKMLGKEGADVRFAIAGALVAGNVDFAKQLAEKDPEFELTDDNIKIFMDYITKAAEKKNLDVGNLSKLSNELISFLGQIKNS